MVIENPHQADFARYSREKAEFWKNFEIPGLTREDDAPQIAENILTVTDDFIEQHMGGPLLIAQSLDDNFPTIEAIFAQTKPEGRAKFGNTEPPEPGEVHLLGAGATDYFYYGNTSRLIVDGVLAGGNTARAFGEIRSLWHPKLVELRMKLRDEMGLPHLRHPHQIIVSASGALSIEDDQIFNLKDVKTYILTADSAMANLTEKVRDRNIEIISMGEEPDLKEGMRKLKQLGISYISAVGGRGVVTQLIDARHSGGRLIRGVHLTTAPKPGGVPNTPFYTGAEDLQYDVLTRRVGKGKDEGVTYEYLVLK